MTQVWIADFERIVDGRSIGFSMHSEALGFAFDSRAVQPGELFVAVTGSHVDGHDFAKDALSRGAVGTLGERPVSGPHIVVPSVVEALACFGSYHRSFFKGPVVGITGSAGKTTTKEFTAAALAALGKVLKSEGNRNTEYTGPLVWADAEGDEESAVIEMAMRGFGQIAHLAKIAQPTVGVITNIGHSHAEMVGGREGIAQAKSELLTALPADGISVLPRDDDFFEYLSGQCPGRMVSFGLSDASDCRIEECRAESWTSCHVKGTCAGSVWEAILPAAGRHVALDAAAAVAVAVVLGVPPQLAADCISRASLPPMRMEIIMIDGTTVVLDTYNASPASTIAALETLAEVPCPGERLAVIGDMRELGAYADEGHREVGRAVARASLANALFFGPMSQLAREEAIAGGMSKSATAEATTIEEVGRFVAAARPGDVVLIKGSRALELERALEPLQERRQ